MRFSSVRRTAVLTFTAFTLALSSACFGSFNATRKLWMFNRDVSKNKFAQEAVFLGMVILPVYGIGALVDVVGGNLVEFWTGENPIKMASTRIDEKHVVQGVIQVKNGERTMVIKGFEADSLQWTTTAKPVPNTDQMAFTTVFSSGRVVQRVVGVDAAGNPYLVSNNDRSP
jgi:hypothetical protein